jgi:acyl-CoA thioester hydrolase
MNSVKHKTPVEIRFVDVDVFGHVNNANYLTYIEQARVEYFNQIVGWDYDWSKEGIILARAEINFINPIHFRDKIFAFAKCSRMGNKSFDLQYHLIKVNDEKEILMADCTTVMVAFDYMNKKSIPVSEEWKQAIKNFEGDTFGVLKNHCGYSTRT